MALFFADLDDRSDDAGVVIALYGELHIAFCGAFEDYIVNELAAQGGIESRRAGRAGRRDLLSAQLSERCT